MEGVAETLTSSDKVEVEVGMISNGGEGMEWHSDGGEGEFTLLMSLSGTFSTHILTAHQLSLMRVVIPYLLCSNHSSFILLLPYINGANYLFRTFLLTFLCIDNYTLHVHSFFIFLLVLYLLYFIPRCQS